MKFRIINIITFAIALMATVVAISVFPDVVPIHFNAQGIADGWGSKYTLLVTPIIILAMQAFGEVMVRIFKKQTEDATDEKTVAETQANLKLMPIVFTVVSAVFALLNFGFLYMTYAQLDAPTATEFDIIKYVVTIMGLSFLILGNYMPKSRKNSTMGLRCKWSMYNDATWQKSNRFGGIAFMMLGIASVIFALACEGTMAVIYMLAALVWVSIISLIYAYSVYKQEVQKEQK